MAHAVKAESLDTPPRMTFDEFVEWADEDTRAEWVDGEVVFMTPVSDQHDDLQVFLVSLLRGFAETRSLGRVKGPEYMMRLRKRPAGRVPDVLFVAQENVGRITRTYLDGPADLVVEVVSQEDPARDHVREFAEYEQAGVREYWLIDPGRKGADFFVLDSDGHFKDVIADDDGVYRSSVMPGLWLKVDWLWQEPLPKLVDVLKEWGLV